MSTSPTTTTWGRKRAATIAAGSTIQGSAGLEGPPLTATPPAISSSVTTIAVALTRSGWGLVRMRRSTEAKLSAQSAKNTSVHQPIHGAAASSAMPTAPAPTRRIMRTRSLASTTRVRSSSVGHSQDDDPSLIMPSFDRRGRGLEAWKTAGNAYFTQTPVCGCRAFHVIANKSQN